MSTYNPKQVEEEILAFWEKHETYKKLKERNAAGKPFYYLDGPPYTTGQIHIGHAWGKALRDSILRFKRMNGFDVWDRPGFDMHGLPIEVKVEKKLGITNKKEIETKIGVAEFTKACKEFAIEHMHPMIADFKRLGAWLDWEKPYQTVENEYIEGAWWALKEAWKRGLLYKGKRSMSWCPQSGTALAKHELEYHTVTDHAIYVKLPIVGKENEFLVVWTTTPWTIPFNLAVMVHPEYSYVRAEVMVKGEMGQEQQPHKEIWIVAEALAKSCIETHCKSSFTVLETFQGSTLAGVKYTPVFHELSTVQNILSGEHAEHAFSVLLVKEFVDLSAGTGLVHTAPGCGPEDFAVGQQHGLPPFNEVDEAGLFPSTMETLAGLKAKTDDSEFISRIKGKGLLAGQHKIQHEYAHGWRTKTPIIFRVTDQWFLKTGDLREQMRDENRNVAWVPDWAGNRWFDSWLENLQDWCISRQRYWGIPLPIWENTETGEVRVIGSQHELEEELGKKMDDLHKPWIDAMTLPGKDGTVLRRVPDVLDVWLDSGVSPWATLSFPRKTQTRETFGTPDLILEGKDQIRGWFNSLMCMSMVAEGKAPYKAVYMHGMINDAQGRKMSKSLGNTISPYEVIEKLGADTLRYYSISGAQPGLDLNYNESDAQTKYRVITILWNLHNLLLESLRSSDSVTAADLLVRPAQLSTEDEYMLELLKQTVLDVTDAFESYNLPAAPLATEHAILELSRTYIQLVRDKLNGSKDEQHQVLYTLSMSLVTLLKLFAPVCPFVTETLWQKLKKPLSLPEESIHFAKWPARPTAINTTLLEDVRASKDVIQAVMHLREKIKRSLRWPLATVTVVTKDSVLKRALEHLRSSLAAQVNAKTIVVTERFAGMTYEAQVIHKTVGKEFGKRTPLIQQALADADTTELHDQLLEQGSIMLFVEGHDICLTSDHVVFKEQISGDHEAVPIATGLVIVDKVSTPALEAEGLAREVVRRVQDLRKKAGLTKQDRIDLTLLADGEVQKLLQQWVDSIAEKTGAQHCSLSSPKTLDKMHVATEQIKHYSVVLGFDVVA